MKVSERARELLADAKKLVGKNCDDELSIIATRYIDAIGENRKEAPSNKEAQEKAEQAITYMDWLINYIRNTLKPTSPYGMATDNPFRNEPGNDDTKQKQLIDGWESVGKQLQNLRKPQLDWYAPKPNIAGKENLSVAIDAFGSAARQLVADCAILLVNNGKQLQPSQSGNVVKLSRTAYELTTGKIDNENKKSFAGIAAKVVAQHRETSGQL